MGAPQPKPSPDELGERLQEALGHSDVYRAIDAEPLLHGTTPLAGSCWPVAAGVLAWLETGVPGAGALAAVVADGDVQHVVVRVGPYYLDADGVSTKPDLRARWREFEGLPGATVIGLEGQPAGGMVCPVPLVRFVAGHLRRVLGSPRPWLDLAREELNPAADPGRRLPAGLGEALRALRENLGARDVLTDGRDTIWVLGGPRTLRASLGPGWRMHEWLTASCPREKSYTIDSYLRNADHWHGWALAINYGLQCRGLRAEWEVIPVPSRTVPRKSWSAVKRRWLPAGSRPRYRLCEQAPVPFGSPVGPVLLDVASGLPPLMVTHGVALKSLKNVRQCGGLLWPSWAVAWRRPPTYGDVVFFASTMVLMAALNPTGRPDPDIYIAGTDIWSPDARELALLERAIEWEMAGDKAWWRGDRPREKGGSGERGLKNDLVIQTQTEGLVGSLSWLGDTGVTDPIRSRRVLVRRFREWISAHSTPGAPYEYSERDPEVWGSSVPYPYGEVKVTGKVELSDLPLVVFPRRIKRRVETLLDALGFEGVRYAIAYEGPLHADADDAERRAFAELVTRSVLAWAQQPCHTKGATVGRTLMSDSWRSTYSAVAKWSSAKHLYEAWQRGHCGTRDPGSGRSGRLSSRMRAFLKRKQTPREEEWGLELASAVDEIEDPDVAEIFAEAEVERFRLTVVDATTANALGWFPVLAARGDEVVVLRYGS